MERQCIVSAADAIGQAAKFRHIALESGVLSAVHIAMAVATCWNRAAFPSHAATAAGCAAVTVPAASDAAATAGCWCRQGRAATN